MLDKLRRRFVAIIMALVGSLVIAMVGISLHNTISSLDSLVSRSLDMALEERTAVPNSAANGQTMGMEHLPVLWIDLSSSGAKLGSNESRLDFDTDHLSEAVSDALSSDADKGRLAEYHLTWKRASSPFGWRLAIADTTSIDSERESQLVKSLELAGAGMVVVFVLALLLSRWAAKPVKVAWEQQHQFVADASHELKTPLAVIIANNEILESKAGELPEGCSRWVRSTHDEAQRMRGLVEEMLELARTEEDGGSARRNVDVNLSELVEGEALQFDAVAYERGTLIESDIAEDVHVLGDPDQLDRLVKTLIDNACKYASAGSTIQVLLERRAGAVSLSVTNAGEPIPAEDLPHVFDRFYRSDKARARSTGGFGLGLAIAKGIVESHGGRIEVKSSAEKGTTFTATLHEARE
uniref:sensor histidine kinase n=1 Tax=Parolsenella massiliensis TaxID=1871022 RepID=UPI000934DDA8|nr:HAMP domain-containing sensor histidine kinase [Parolsenella massiliensis]